MRQYENGQLPLKNSGRSRPQPKPLPRQPRFLLGPSPPTCRFSKVSLLPLRKVSVGESAGSKEISQAGDFQCKPESLEDVLASPQTPQNKVFKLGLGSSPAIHPEMREVVLHPPLFFPSHRHRVRSTFRAASGTQTSATPSQ